MDERVNGNAMNPNDGKKVNNSSNTFNLVIGIATLLIALLGATFAYFSATAMSAENDVTVKSAYVSISYDGGTEIKATNLIPATENVALNKYMKDDVEVYDPEKHGELILDYDRYSSDMLDRKCVDALGKEVCYVYQFSVLSEGVEGGKTDILASIRINNNQFTNLSYLVYEVVPREINGAVVTDKYGFDIIDRYTPVGTFKEIDKNPDNPWRDENGELVDEEQVKFAYFERPYDIVKEEEGTEVETVYPVACLFGYGEGEQYKDLRGDNTDRCLSYGITNNVKHTFQVLIWLEETGSIQEEQGMTFEGTVTIEVSGGINTSEYEDGVITGKD